MKKNTLNKIFFLGFIAIIALACRPKKTIVAIPIAVKTDSAAINIAKRAEQIALLKNKNLQFNTLAIKSKAVLNADGETNNVTLFVRIKKDKKFG